MRAFQVAIVLAAGAMLMAAPAAGAKGPVNISAPPESTVTDPTGNPAGPMRYAAIGGHERTTLAAISTTGGELRQVSSIAGNWALPAVTVDGEAGGLSADGETLVLIRPDYSYRPESTRFLVVDPSRLRARKPVTVDGSFSFDAISPDGETMYLVQYLDPVNPLAYRVRAYDLARGELVPGEIVDPAEPDERMAGQPVARQASPDGRWAYTLYAGGEEAFIHALDTEGETAACVDIEELTPGQAFQGDLAVAAGGAITVSRRGEPVATVDPDGFEVTPVEDAPAQVPADEGAGAWPFVAGIAVVAALAGGGIFALRRRRRRADEDELGPVFAAAQADEAEPEREREPEPVP